MSERLRTILVGTDGAGGQEHQRLMYAPVLLAHDAFDVVGIADDSGAAEEERGRSGQLAAEFGVTRIEDLDAALDGVDVACVCSPYGRREAVMVAAVERGVHVLVDKPLALTADEARRLGSIAAGRDVIAMPAHHLRFHPSVVRAIAALARGDIGLPWGVQGEFLAAEGDAAWTHGELANFLSYPLDIVRAMLALEPQRVAAWRASPFFSGDHEDMAVLSLTFDHEIPVSLTVGRTSVDGHRNGPAGVHRYRVMGTEGVLTVDLSAPSVLMDGPVRRKPFGRGSVEGLADHLAAAVRGQVRPTLGFGDAIVVAEVVEAARNAADRASVVALDQRTGV